MQALESANLQPGNRVLVHAASGGVGVFAVQLAKQLFGSYVVGTTGPANLEFVKVPLTATDWVPISTAVHLLACTRTVF